jgi:hypothetical protein
MKKSAKWLSGALFVLLVVYLAGPKPPKADFEIPSFDLPSSLVDLDRLINEAEKGVKGIKPDNQARIVWADSSKKEKTKIAVLYLHGFSSSQAEGEPVQDPAEKYNANLYLHDRLPSWHRGGDTAMISLTAGKYLASPKKHSQLQETWR